MKRVIGFLFGILVSVSGTAQANNHQPSKLDELMTAYEAQGWEAVGRLNIGNTGMCTGALIAPNLVLTAAHCLFDQRTGREVPARTITFLAGYRNGSAAATRTVRRAVVHPDYDYSDREGRINVTHDVALLELISPIRLSNVAPFDIAERPRKGASVGVVSYAHDRSDRPSLQEVCHVLARQRGTLVLSCDVDFGSSGAPIFADVEGTPHIVSVVSAKAMIQGRRVALGTLLEKPLQELKRLMATEPANPSAGTTLNSGSGNVVVRRGGNSGSGAKFVRP